MAQIHERRQCAKKPVEALLAVINPTMTRVPTWSTSRMERLIFWPCMEMTFTHTSWPRLTTSLALPTRVLLMFCTCTRPSCRVRSPCKVGEVT